MPNPLARARSFWTDHGEWVLLGIVFALALTAGYGLAAKDFQATILKMQGQHERVMAAEKKYLRDVIEQKNNDIRFLQGKQSEQVTSAGSTAKSATEALKALSESTGSTK